MNREQLDLIVKAGLVAHANRLLADIGEFALATPEDHRYRTLLMWAAQQAQKRERALALVSDDAARLKIVDEILKEMKP